MARRRCVTHTETCDGASEYCVLTTENPEMAEILSLRAQVAAQQRDLDDARALIRGAETTILRIAKERDEARAALSVMRNAASELPCHTATVERIAGTAQQLQIMVREKDAEIARLKAALSAAETCTRCGVFKTHVDDAHKHAALCGGEFKLGGG